MAMPLTLIWKVKITTKEKMGLAGIFSIGFIIIIFAIVRAVQVVHTTRSDPVLLSLWGVLESSVCEFQCLKVRLLGRQWLICLRISCNGRLLATL